MESHITFNTVLSKVPIKGKGVEIFENLLAEIIFNPQEWLLTIFSFQYHPYNKHWGLENKRNDHQLKTLLIVKEILFVRTIGNV